MSLSLLSVMHVNVNCSDLERSLGFYRDRVGLVSQSHTNPLPQDGAAFGLRGRVVWDAHLLHDDRGFASAAVDLLEWKTPAPVGVPAREVNQLGFARLCLAHPDLDALHASFHEAGVVCRSAPVSIPVLQDQPVRFFCCEDPDGTLVEFVERPGPLRLSHININCRDLDASSDWYQRVLGVKPIATRAEPPAAPGIGFGLDGHCRYRADFLAVAGNADSLILDLLEWKDPKPIGEPFREAHHLGLFRMAFMVEDAAASCAELDRLGVTHSGVCWLEMGPEIPIDGLNAVFFRDPDGSCLELIETPQISQG
jgi:catechol 2,3-dioxygenase-like lactoylglutathione lyase family enzyme